METYKTQLKELKILMNQVPLKYEYELERRMNPFEPFILRNFKIRINRNHARAVEKLIDNYGLWRDFVVDNFTSKECKIKFNKQPYYFMNFLRFQSYYPFFRDIVNLD